MKKLKVSEGVTWIGAQDHKLRVFDIIMHTEFGTSYNSYLVKGSEKNAVIETVKLKFIDEFIEKLTSEIDINNIDYIIVDHTEPDHVGSVEELLKLSPKAKVVGSATAIRFLKAIANMDFESIIVDTNDEISLGDKTLQFISAPFLHWPDSMYTYLKEDNILFTCDSFGSHYAFDEVFSSKLTNHEDYYKALRYYFDMIMGPFKPYMLEAINKIEKLPIDIICPGHGPVLDDDPLKIVEQCKEWSTEYNPNNNKTIIIPYVSAYGYTEEIAENIRNGITSLGDINVELYDMVYTDKEDVLSKIKWADGIIFGSPTINGDALFPIWELLIRLSPIGSNNKFASTFGSYGWSGEAVPNIEARLKQLRMKLLPGLKINFKPSKEEIKLAYDFGVEFGKSVISDNYKQKVEEKKEEVENDQVDGEVKLWRCIICGEVYEGVEPPEICPACGATAEQFEVYEAESIQFSSDSKENIIIIGNNAAGISAVEAIRRRNNNATIMVVDKDTNYAYYRPILSDYISDSHEEQYFYLHDKEWYRENNVNLKLGSCVTKIDKENNRIIINNEEAIQYDKLILANGSDNFVPPITDIDKQGVFTIKTLEDANQVKEYAKKSKKVAIIGGGLLALEAGWELRTLGLDVTIIEMATRILPRQLDDDGSNILEQGISKVGINVYKGVTANAILGDEFVTGVQLVDGTMIDADMVIVSVGVRANTELAQEAGIMTNRGVIVDEKMATNIENIYAAGDVAEYKNINYAIWPEAVEQGKVAGANAIGDNISYNNITPNNIFNGMNVNVFSIGDLGVQDDISYHNIMHMDVENKIYKKLYFIDDKFVGGILIGDVSKSADMINGIKQGYNIKQIVKKVLL
ncbi:MAG: FAD-dependent oxidoreductase [Vallitalea sp.]|jgi:flavorubredoxin/NADPH-dependent 2,4-dienoyl-CoA reductase/sulfur reductase-like enzyme/rubredoxin|nr:FAD-dependent oxidoreductase [Vallitalea sp.]